MKECKFIDYIEFVHPSGDRVVPHKHRHYELIYYICGEGVTYFGMDEKTYTEHTIQLVGRDVFHFEEAKRETKVKCIIFDCDEKCFSASRMITKNSENEKSFDRIFFRMERIRAQYKHERDDVTLDDEVGYIVLNLLILIDGAQKKEGSNYENVIKNVQNYIKAHFNQTINFSILCESIGYSYDWFRHVFKKETGVSLKKYQQSIRILKAKIMLSGQGLTIKEVAKRCGFKSDIRFIDCFKQTQKMTPAQYKKASRNAEIRVFNAEDEKRGKNYEDMDSD